MLSTLSGKSGIEVDTDRNSKLATGPIHSQQSRYRKTENSLNGKEQEKSPKNDGFDI